MHGVKTNHDDRMILETLYTGFASRRYLNGCACGERVELTKNYEGDIRSLHAFGFDGVKIDGCGAQRNNTLYAQLMRDTGKNYTIENCQ